MVGLCDSSCFSLSFCAADGLVLPVFAPEDPLRVAASAEAMLQCRVEME
jgi:hypothetical protein